MDLMFVKLKNENFKKIKNIQFEEELDLKIFFFVHRKNSFTCLLKIIKIYKIGVTKSNHINYILWR
jgi:hypothetical protein